MDELAVSGFTIEETLPQRQTALFNTLSQSICILEQEIWDDIRRGNGYRTEQAHELLVRGFLVENGLDEGSILTHWRLAQVHDLTRLKYYLHLGDRAAVQPRETHSMGISTRGMGLDTARAVLDFLMSDMEAKRPLEVEFVFGGPDCFSNTRAMNYLTEGLYHFCRGRGIQYYIVMLSYGRDLMADRILALKDYGLEKIRIVVLEIPSNRDNGRDEGLISKITALESLVRIDLEIRYDRRQNWRTDMSGLLDKLASRNLQTALGRIGIYPSGRDRSRMSAVFHPFFDCLCQGNLENERWLKPELARRGFSLSRKPPRRRCPGKYRSTTFIEPDGRISSCPCLYDHPELDYGHVSQGVDFRKEARIRMRSVPARCRSCTASPLCDSGCRRLLMESPRGDSEKNCLNDGLESELRTYLRNYRHSF